MINENDSIAIPKVYDYLLKQNHILIGGATGSGKSVLINNIIYRILLEPCNKNTLVLLDPKKVELYQYKNVNHTRIYASEQNEIYNALKRTIQMIENRYQYMQENYLKMYNHDHIYVFIDELADLVLTDKRTVSLLQRIVQIGRAAGVHLIAATQSPTTQVIKTPIKVNFDCRIGLRTRNAQDSRNIIDSSGCECLPRYGCMIVVSPDFLNGVTFKIEQIQENRIRDIIQFRSFIK